MNRRDFIVMGTAGASALCFGCGSKRSAREWESRDKGGRDIRLQVLHYARLAPSSHNTQPWLVELTSSGMQLYVDRSRLLLATDPLARQIHISQGTFLEHLDIAARKLGYTTAIRYFPDGEYSNRVVEDRPVAEVVLLPDPGATTDPLFEELPRRITNKRPYNLDCWIASADVDALHAAVGTDIIGWRAVADRSRKKDIAGICKEAMRVEVSSVDRNRETARWFRFSDRELEEKRDGFGIAQTGTDGVTKWFAETFVLNRERAADPKGAFAQGAVTQTGEQAGTATVFAALITSTNSRLDQVLAGRAYARVQLTASERGLAMQPLSQVLEEYAEMDWLQSRMKQTLGVADSQTVQMLFRLGYAKPTPHSPRREEAELIRPNDKGLQGNDEPLEG